LRHWRERRRGPRKWIESHPQVPCIPVRGYGDIFALVSLQSATSIRSSIFLPDFPEVQERLLSDQKGVRLVITAAKSVADSVIDVMRDAGLRSLRKQAGRAVRILTSESLTTSPMLDAILLHIQAPATVRSLTQRLPQFEVPVASLRH